MSEYKAGDLIAVSGKGLVSNGIQIGTWALPNIGPLGRWGWAGISHVGIVVPVCPPGYDRPVMLVYESTSFGRPPCVRTNRENPVGVQAHEIQTIAEAGGDVWHYPLKRELYYHEEDRLLSVIDPLLGSSYDMFGAGMAWGGIVKWLLTSIRAPEKNGNLFCSELVAFVWTQIGILQTANPGAWNPTRLLRHARRCGIVGYPRLIS